MAEKPKIKKKKALRQVIDLNPTMPIKPLPEDVKVDQLIRDMGGAQNLTQYRHAMEEPQQSVAKPMYREYVAKALEKLLDAVTKDNATYNRVRSALQKESVDLGFDGALVEAERMQRFINNTKTGRAVHTASYGAGKLLRATASDVYDDMGKLGQIRGARLRAKDPILMKAYHERKAEQKRKDDAARDKNTPVKPKHGDDEEKTTHQHGIDPEEVRDRTRRAYSPFDRT